MGLSLRERLIARGITDEAAIRANLERAFTALAFAPHLKLKDFKPRFGSGS